MGEVLQTVQTICICLGVIFSIIQLYLMRKSMLADHERKKKQSTIEFYNNINIESSKLTPMIEKNAEENGILLVKTIKETPALMEAAARYLTLMERFSVGVNTNVYDINVYDRMAGDTTIRNYERLRLWIEDVRKRRGNFVYTDFERMIYELKEIRKNRFPKADIDFASMKYSK